MPGLPGTHLFPAGGRESAWRSPRGRTPFAADTHREEGRARPRPRPGQSRRGVGPQGPIRASLRQPQPSGKFVDPQETSAARRPGAADAAPRTATSWAPSRWPSPARRPVAASSCPGAFAHGGGRAVHAGRRGPGAGREGAGKGAAGASADRASADRTCAPAAPVRRARPWPGGAAGSPGRRARGASALRTRPLPVGTAPLEPGSPRDGKSECRRGLSCRGARQARVRVAPSLFPSHRWRLLPASTWKRQRGRMKAAVTLPASGSPLDGCARLRRGAEAASGPAASAKAVRVSVHPRPERSCGRGLPGATPPTAGITRASSESPSSVGAEASTL